MAKMANVLAALISGFLWGFGTGLVVVAVLNPDLFSILMKWVTVSGIVNLVFVVFYILTRIRWLKKQERRF